MTFITKNENSNKQYIIANYWLNATNDFFFSKMSTLSQCTNNCNYNAILMQLF
jgi:hypothetical protein